MTEQRQTINTNDLARGIVLGMISLGIWRFYGLTTPRGHRAAEEVLQHIEREYSERFEIDAYIVLDEIYGKSPTWGNALDNLIISGILLPALDGSHLNGLNVESAIIVIGTMPGDLNFWQKMARLYQVPFPDCID